MIAWVSRNDDCVANRGAMNGSVQACQYENQTGYTHASGEVDFRDTFMNYHYRIQVTGVFGPTGAVGSMNVMSVNSDYREACAGANFLRSLSRSSQN